MKLLTKSVVVATVLCFVAGLSAGAAVSAYTAPTGVLFTGQNLFALPVVPTDPDGGGPGYPEWILAGFDLTGTNLQRWNAATQAMVSRPDTTPVAFGNLLSTDGYWLTGPATVPAVTFNGADDLQQTDYWISLPKTGTTVVGNPYLYSVDWSRISVTNGMETVGIDAAISTKGWLTTIVGYDNSFKYNVPVGPTTSVPSPNSSALNSTRLEAWRGYLVTSTVDNLALIITARKAADADKYSISGTITVTGGNAPKCPVIVELRDAGTGAKLVRTVKHVDGSGAYAIDGVAPGTYNVAFKGANTLATLVSGVAVTTANVTGVNTSLVLGDIDGNNHVYTPDFLLWKAAYNKRPGQAGWDVRADLDGNAQVYTPDFLIWKSKYNQRGVTTW